MSAYTNISKMGRTLTDLEKVIGSPKKGFNVNDGTVMGAMQQGVFIDNKANSGLKTRQLPTINAKLLNSMPASFYATQDDVAKLSLQLSALISSLNGKTTSTENALLAEIVTSRIGHDGTQYKSLSEAIHDQISDIRNDYATHKDLDKFLNDYKASIVKIMENSPLLISDGSALTTKDGEVIQFVGTVEDVERSKVNFYLTRDGKLREEIDNINMMNANARSELENNLVALIDGVNSSLEKLAIHVDEVAMSYTELYEKYTDLARRVLALETNK